MQFLKNLFLLLLVLTPSVTWAIAKDECIISFVNSSNGNFVLKKCSFSKTESSYKVLGPTEKLTQSTLPLEKYLTEAMETGKLVTVEHKPSYEFTSIIPPKERSTNSQILFVDNEFRVSEVEKHTPSAALILLYLWIVLITINSGNIGEITFNLNKRLASFSIVIALIFGGLTGTVFGSVAGLIFGVATGFYKGVMFQPYNNTEDHIFVMTCASITGAITGWLSGYIIDANGLTAIITLEWIGFCLFLIVIEYIVVFLRHKRAEEKLTKATLN